MSRRSSTSEEIPKHLSLNLGWLFDPVSRRSRYRSGVLRKRCAYVRQKLSSDQVLRMLSPPSKWQKSSYDAFKNAVQQISQREIKWSPDVMKYLERLKLDDLHHSEDFKAFYHGIKHFES
jgi:hypothetical protein